jgi:hypothetical protein
VSASEYTEVEFRRALLLYIGARPGYRVWAQNCGKIVIPQKNGSKRAFDAGPPDGAADISGVVRPEGWRIEFELKGPKTRVTDNQKNWSARMQEFGAVVAFYRVDPKRSLNENLDRAAYELEAAIDLKRRGAAGVQNCDCSSCTEVRQARNDGGTF